MTNEITSMGNEMDEMDISINAATNEINRVKSQSGNVDASFVRNICRKLSSPIDIFAGKLKSHVNEMSKYWDIVENSYLSLLDNQYAQNVNNIEDLCESMTALENMQNAIYGSNENIEGFYRCITWMFGNGAKIKQSNFFTYI